MPQSIGNYIVIGASSGIGLAVSQHLSNTATQLYCVARTTCPQGEWIPADITTRRGIDAIKDAVGAVSIDGLLFMAGCWEKHAFTSQYEFLKSSEEEIRSVIDTNLLAPILVTQALSKNLMLAKNSSVIYMGSDSGLDYSAPGEVAYCASKFGLRGAVQSLNQALNTQGVSFTVINAGDVETPEVKNDIANGRLPDNRPIPLSDVLSSIDYVLSLSTETVPDEINLLNRQ